MGNKPDIFRWCPSPHSWRVGVPWNCCSLQLLEKGLWVSNRCGTYGMYMMYIWYLYIDMCYMQIFMCAYGLKARKRYTPTNEWMREKSDVQMIQSLPKNGAKSGLKLVGESFPEMRANNWRTKYRIWRSWVFTLPETNIFAPENGWLEDEIPFGAKGLFSGANC